ncbi:MAG: tetratricopeptide repeat protein [Thermodesulfovibrionales bacterium]|nr:tetratricopeptide repeat protein [Thermodesulfovibrionales bacterium]
MKYFVIIFAFIFSLLPYSLEAVNRETFPDKIKKAWDSVEDKRPIEAINILSEYAPDQKSLFPYHYTLARAYSRLNLPTKSMEHYRLAYVYATKDSEREQIFFERAQTYANNKYYDEAILSYRIFLRRFPESRLRQEAFLGLAESFYNIGNFTEALNFYQKIGTSNSALYGKANALHSMGRVAEAHDIYLSLIQKGDKGYLNSQQTAYSIGENFRLMNKLSYAKVYLALVKDYPLKYKADLSNALIAMSENRVDMAIKFFDLASQSPDRDIKRKVLLYQAELYLKENKTEEAKSKLTQIRNKYPYGKDYDEAVLKLAQIYKKEGSLHESASLLRELVFRKKPLKAALDEFELLLIEAKNRNQNDLINLWKNVGQWMLEPSRSDFVKKILPYLKSERNIYLNICKWLIKNGSNENKMFAKLLIAELYAELGDLKTATAYLQDIKLTEQNDEIRRINSRILHLKGENEKALSELLNIKEPDADDANLFLSISLEIPPTLKNQQELVSFLEKVIKRETNKPKLYLSLADSYYKIGKTENALKQYKLALEINEKNKGLSEKDIQWCLYRISLLAGKDDSKTALDKLQKGNDLLNRYANARSKENNLNEKLKERF